MRTESITAFSPRFGRRETSFTFGFSAGFSAVSEPCGFSGAYFFINLIVCVSSFPARISSFMTNSPGRMMPSSSNFLRLSSEARIVSMSGLQITERIPLKGLMTSSLL